jgi:hypothetical protein
MSRELKYRVYIKEASRYVYFSLGDFDYSKRVANNQSDIPIEQYTGMMDKYNQPIYEGDVIRGLFDFGPAGFKEEILPVTWHNERGYQWDYWRLMTIEVLGNLNEWPCRKPGSFDENGECLTCDCWATDCPFLKFSSSPKLILK